MCTPAKCRPNRPGTPRRTVRLVRRLGRRGKWRDTRFASVSPKNITGKYARAYSVLTWPFLCCGCGCGFYCGHLPLLTNLPHLLEDLKFTFCSSPVRSSGIFFKIYGVPFQVQWSCYGESLGSFHPLSLFLLFSGTAIFLFDINHSVFNPVI